MYPLSFAIKIRELLVYFYSNYNIIYQQAYVLLAQSCIGLCMWGKHTISNMALRLNSPPSIYFLQQLNKTLNAYDLFYFRYETGLLEYRSGLRLLVHPDPNQPLTAEVKKEERSRSTSSSPLGSPRCVSYVILDKEHSLIQRIYKGIPR